MQATCGVVGVPNLEELDKAGGAVKLLVNWNWDGASTPQTGCDGPVNSVQAINTTTDIYYAHLPRRVRGGTVLQLDPQANVTYTGNQLKTAGLDTHSALLGLVIDQSAT